MPIRAAGGTTPAGRTGARLTPRRLAGVVVLVIAVTLLVVVVVTAALNS